ncbi:MAG: alpha-E domain-containing protein, partial [Pseudomonadales bacterium]|nr:alpha-E domain-containing protein [Pseudomonadales bacterium]
MLSTVAERLYWAARYLERVENTARLVKVYTNLILDLPDGMNVGWYNLIELNSCRVEFDKRFKNRTERNVVKFLMADPASFCSLTSAVNAVRENIRTSRDEMPVETWEQVNELHIFVKENVQKGLNRSKRHEFLDGVIQGCQQLNGLLSGTMSQGAGWQFLRVGRNLERADMTTRILDAGVTAVMQSEGVEAASNINQLVWGNVLVSLSAYIPYRKVMRTAVNGEDVTQFLVEDPHFPRSLSFCFNHMQDAVSQLPRHEKVVKQIDKLNKQAVKNADYENLDQHFRDYINDLQIALADMHFLFSE